MLSIFGDKFTSILQQNYINENVSQLQYSPSNTQYTLLRAQKEKKVKKTPNFKYEIIENRRN